MSEELEEWELLAMQASEVLKDSINEDTPHYIAIQESYREACRLRHEEATKARAARDQVEHQYAKIDLKADSQAGWKQRRLVLNKIVDLHESHDDIDIYGFPLSGPFSLLSMKARHQDAYTNHVNSDRDLGLGSGKSAFGDVLYSDVSCGQNSNDRPFDRGGLVAKLAWGLLQSESYNSATNDHHGSLPREAALGSDVGFFEEAGDEEEVAFDVLEQSLSGSRKEVDIVQQPDMFDRASEALQIATSLKQQSEKVPAATTKKHGYQSRITDTTASHQKAIDNADRLKRLSERMSQEPDENKRAQLVNSAIDVSGHADDPNPIEPTEPVVSEALYLELEAFAEEVHRRFVSGRDEQAEDEVNDLLARNAQSIKQMLKTDEKHFDDIKREDAYFD